MCDLSKKSHLYIFLDESGNLTFNNKGTKYIVLTAVTFVRPFKFYETLDDLKYNLIEYGTEVECFHAAEDSRPVRKRVYDALNRYVTPIRADSVIVEKRKTHPSVQEWNRFYPKMLGYLLKYILNGISVTNYQEVIIITDQLPLNKKRAAMEKAVKLTLAEMLRGEIRYRIYHHDDQSSYGLQIADYYGWAIWRAWEVNQTMERAMLNGVVSEFDIFKDGRYYYY